MILPGFISTRFLSGWFLLDGEKREKTAGMRAGPDVSFPAAVVRCGGAGAGFRC